jgi:hypothetical protein
LESKPEPEIEFIPEPDSLPELQRVAPHTSTSTTTRVPDELSDVGTIHPSAPFSQEAVEAAAQANAPSPGPSAMEKISGRLGPMVHGALGALGRGRNAVGARAFSLLRPRIGAWADLEAGPRQQMERRLGLLLPAALLGVLFLCTFTVVLIATSGGDLARIDRGEAAAVLAEIQAKEEADVGPQDLLMQGHALAALKRPEEALVSYQKALEGGAQDERALDMALGELWRESPKPAITLLVGWADPVANDRLKALLQTETSWAGKHALTILKERFADKEIDRMAFGIRLLYDGDTCPIRAEGLRILRTEGRGESALQAITAAQARMPENKCMVRSLAKGLKEVTKRAESGPAPTQP